MNRLGRYAVFAAVLGLSACLDRCRDRKGDEQAGAVSGSGNAASQSLILAAQQQGAFLPPELADPRYADESTLPMGPFQLPAADLSKAAVEVEPNNSESVASPLGPGLVVRGETSSGDYDYYFFETTGEPQLWAIEAVGKSVGNLLYQATSAETTQAQELDSGKLVIPSLFLAPGRHTLAIRPTSSASGPYTLRAIALGKPDLRMEREPNDTEPFALRLRFGIPRAGLLLDRNDRDHYTFELREGGRVSLRVTSPPDIMITANLYRKGSSPSHTFTSKARGAGVNMDVMLPAGEYIVVLRSNDAGGSRVPYKLRIEQADPFSPPGDREPNNDYDQAAPLPSDLVLRGNVGEYSDPDWYRLPTLSQETSMRMQVLSLSSGMSPGGSIYVVNRSGGRNEYLNWARRDSVWEMRLPPNAPLFIQLTNEGAYQLRLSFTPGIPSIAGKAPYTVTLSPGPHLVEAFSTLAQTQSLEATLNNPGSERVQVALEAVVGHSSWTVSPARQTVTLEPGKQLRIPLQLSLAPDAAAGEAVQVAVRATSPLGSASAVTTVYALCGATPANPQTWSPLPAAMLGGLNLAALSLGAKPVAPDGKLTRERMLYDGITPSDAAWTGDRTSADPDILLTVALAGDREASVSGITLYPGNSGPPEQVDQFDVLVSTDGQSYRPVMSGRLRPVLAEQAFAFPQPVPARFAQLRVRSNQPGPQNSRSTLGEWKVIGAPGEQPFTATGFNLADPGLGGHVVWAHPLLTSARDAVLTDAADVAFERLDPSSPNEWVVGFRNNRAAQIGRLEWVQPATVPGVVSTLTSVDVSVSTESPIGPWTSVGTWKVGSAPGSTTPLTLTQPVWTRFVRFSTTEPRKAGEYWRLAETIRIFERAADANYRSVLAEWGHYSRPAIYERLVVAPVSPKVEGVTGNGKQADAKKIESGKAYSGRVVIEKDEDWYRIEVPRDHNRISIDLKGDPSLRAVATLQDESGKIVASDLSPSGGGIMRVDALVEGGRTYFLRLVEPPRSIALIWDNSSSIRNFTTPLYRALGRFVEAVQPRTEFANLMPLQLTDPKFLLEQWSDQPYVLQGAVQNYSRMDGSSNVELALLAATQKLEPRQGSKAIVLITDAASDGYNKTSELWAALNRVSARIFAVELQLGNAVGIQQQLMQDWASANDGHYSTFRTNDDLDMAFERASCYLRKPARFTLTVATRFEEAPAPGGLEVALATEAMAENAVEIILDASGSMLQMLGNRRRMDIARSTLVDLVEKTLPAGTPFAFRAFGTRVANCESDLLMKLQPLDRVRTGAMVRKLNATNMAKTPLGASLLAVGEDLKGVKGQKVVVLLTDGEETCGGDPAAAIESLKKQGLDIRVNVVGFAVDDASLKVSFERWAELGGGRFFDAKNGQELSKALTDALRPKFQVTDATGSVVAEGTAGGAAVELPVGTYTVRVLTSPVRTFDRVRINSKQRARVEVRGAAR